MPTSSPTVPSPTNSPSSSPFVSPSYSPVQEQAKLPSRHPTINSIAGLTPAPVGPTDFPTQLPTASLEPTMHPTTAEPTLAPVVPMRAYTVTTLTNVPERLMTGREVEKYLEIVTLFLRRHSGSSMVLDRVDMWHQELILVDDISPHQASQGAHGSRARRLQRIKKKPNPEPPVAAMAITLVLKISIFNLPFDLLSNLASVAIEQNEQELVELLHKQQAFYTFFKLVDGIGSRTILEVTYTPTQEPTTLAYWEAKQSALEAGALEDEAEDADNGIGFGTFVAIGLGLLWCLLTVVSASYLIGERGKMEEQKDMENLLTVDRAGPLGGCDATRDVSISVRSAKSTTDPESELQDHMKNTRLSTETRLELSHLEHRDELDNGELKKPGADVNVNRKNGRVSSKARSMVTAKENRKLLEKESKNLSRRMSRRPSGTEAWSMVVTSQKKREALGREQADGTTTADHQRPNSAVAKEKSGSEKATKRKLEQQRSRSLIHRTTDAITLYEDGLEGPATKLLTKGRKLTKRGKQHPQARTMPPALVSGPGEMLKPKLERQNSRCLIFQKEDEAIESGKSSTTKGRKRYPHAKSMPPAPRLISSTETRRGHSLANLQQNKRDYKARAA